MLCSQVLRNCRSISKAHCRFLSTAQESQPATGRVVASLIVQRKPVILPELNKFERTYYAYRDELARREAAPFASEFYFKKGSTSEKEWNQRQKHYQSLLKKGWSALLADAEKSVGTAGLAADSTASESASATTTSSTADGSNSAAKDDATYKAAPRITQADKDGDLKSLDRALDQSLYLLVKKPRQENAWQFPQGGHEGLEFLHRTALRELAEECGTNMDVWALGRGPVGHYSYKFPADHAAKVKAESAKVFFFKAYIFAGQVELNKKELSDFVWVTKDEIPKYVSKDYWNAVQDIL
ncbi:hypothetical protein H4R33_005916 [Dimargaris cristalligena]|uniref:Large ribosomal subunit protein mL46 n=1 Tax=Dimargaris cristalligena TaxID=215637 RepID=A0A4Q0A0I9_9FUNG|nr:hypothetical protein H4R33_005916 [Dimargaris cristalligena]RKP39238.1 39S mitochondrial ribosomal protein L46-domain-containing protein [Dimargaris cristalligena]|eukprot:RKP39238.1 39S mitochondrial ribosomal protein L46-domain-containing protein [Dimargaris cristalligena]